MRPSQCPKCGATSYASTLFCQSCGEPQTNTGELQQGYDNPSPTDWYGARPNFPPITQPPPAPSQPYYAAQLDAYRCRFCGSPYPPVIVKRLGVGGWIVLVVGLFFCLVGALVAFACMNEYRVCPSCGNTL
jgi:hypothetical protein